MFEDYSEGEAVSLTYTSDRSGSEVSRKGTVLQTPDEDGKRGFFIQTDDDQLTGVMAEQVYSITVGENGDGERIVQRKTYLGDIEAASPA